MSDIADCRAMELLYRQRAKADPENSWKWLGQAERWHELGRNQIAWRFQQRNNQQIMQAQWRWGQTLSMAIPASNNRGRMSSSPAQVT
jgi:hypothetical protein